MSATSFRSSGRSTTRSSNSTSPRLPPPGLTGVNGRRCFCPVSAMAANHGPAFRARRMAKMAGFSPFDAVT
jgi:hypothetical protein